MKILSSFTHPQVVLNLYEFLSSAEHKRRIWVTEQLMDRIDFHSMEGEKKNTMEVNGDQKLYVTDIL